MVQLTILVPGQPGGQPVGTLPRVFQTSAKKIWKEALQSFVAAHSAWSAEARQWRTWCSEIEAVVQASAVPVVVLGDFCIRSHGEVASWVQEWQYQLLPTQWT